MAYSVKWSESGTVHVTGYIDVHNATRFSLEMKPILRGGTVDLAQLAIRDRPAGLVITQLLLDAQEYGGTLLGVREPAA